MEGLKWAVRGQERAEVGLTKRSTSGKCWTKRGQEMGEGGEGGARERKRAERKGTREYD
jgi:hypothetical protein